MPSDYAEAVKWYRKAADAGLSNAQTALGTSLLLPYVLCRVIS